uniref:PI31_Prot_C domain-containing protein n=1 Tax=Meloidogyne hapla TaxID=6305 RepID=A0A1I8BXA9_MELHA
MNIIDALRELVNLFFSAGRLVFLFVNDFFNTPWKFDEPGKEVVRQKKSSNTQESGGWSLIGQKSTASGPGGFSEMLKLDGDVPPSLRFSSRTPRPGQPGDNDNKLNSTGNVAPDDPFFNVTSLPTAPYPGVPRGEHGSFFGSSFADKYSADYETLASLDTSAIFPEQTEGKKDN